MIKLQNIKLLYRYMQCTLHMSKWISIYIFISYLNISLSINFVRYQEIY